ncbi:hypothetical protein [Alkalibaculum bacchi]|uniref:hypothetical protein n=1 Tax=Alkalibaculum bacchi TaxID=645887 RepID=UPI0026EDDE14|nr:hypothetical protein [Alkalibaculum bacchi]
MFILRTTQNVSYYCDLFQYEDSVLKIRINAERNMWANVPKDEIKEIVYLNKIHTDIDQFFTEVLAENV